MVLYWLGFSLQSCLVGRKESLRGMVGHMNLEIRLFLVQKLSEHSESFILI